MPIAGINGLIWLSRIGLYLGLFAGDRRRVFCQLDRAGAGGGPSARVWRSLSASSARRPRSGFRGSTCLGLPLSGIFAAGPWKIAFGTSLGPSLLIAIAALGAGVVALRGNVTAWSRALVGAGARRRRPLACGQRTCRDRTAGSADTAGGVPARHWRGLLARRAGAARRHSLARAARKRFRSCTGFRASPCPWSACWR